jgi:hypothetical protein
MVIRSEVESVKGIPQKEAVVTHFEELEYGIWKEMARCCSQLLFTETSVITISSIITNKCTFCISVTLLHFTRINKKKWISFEYHSSVIRKGKSVTEIQKVHLLVIILLIESKCKVNIT